MQIGGICSKETIIAEPNQTILDACFLMQKFNVGSLVIVETDEVGNKPVGMLTDRDIVVRAIAGGLKMDEVKIKDIMSVKLLTGNAVENVASVLHKMKSKEVRRIPVVDDGGYLKGILSIADIFEFLSSEMAEVARVFKNEQSR